MTSGLTVVDTLADGREVHLVELGTAPGPVLRVLTLGATIHDLEVTCGDGVRRHVVLGLATAAERLASSDYLGGTIGRYANRIRDGHLPLPDGDHQLAVHDRGHHLHGGPDGFDRRLWEVVDHDATTAALRLVSPDGDQGFPGEVTAEVRFAVRADGMAVELSATTDRTTVVNLTVHPYLNLEGRGAGTVDAHLLEVPASRYTPVDGAGIPLGDLAPVAGTPFDLRLPTVVGSVVRRAHPQIHAVGGLDHNFVLDSPFDPDGLRATCVLTAPATRTRLTIRSDQPGLQVYTGSSLGDPHQRGDGIALEPQLFPDSPHHPTWPRAVLHPGERYVARHEWRFSTVPPSP